MQKLFYFVIIFSVGFTVAVNGQMSLKLSSDFSQEQAATLGNNNLESNLKLNLPPQVSTPPDMRDIVKGMLLLGILADVSFPMGSDSAFNHIAKTGFSGHVMLTYAVTAALLLQLRAGYNMFGTKTEEGSDFGYDYRYEDSYSQIPILFGAYYLLSTRSAFRPYLGVALGLFLQIYSVKWHEEYQSQVLLDLDDSFNSTGFGIVPGAGFYLLLGSVIMQVAVEYAFLLSDAPTVTYNYNELLAKRTSGNNVTASYEETLSEKPTYLSVMVGLAFPLGGK